MKTVISFFIALALFNFNIEAKKSDDQKVILITGTASGIGKATAEYLI